MCLLLSPLPALICRLLHHVLVLVHVAAKYNAVAVVDDIYIMMQCVSVTKNDHFLLGVS